MDSPTLEELLPKAKQLANENSHVSSAFFQRKLKIPYRLSSGLIDQLEAEGIIAPTNGSARPRKVIKRDLKLSLIHI